MPRTVPTLPSADDRQLTPSRAILRDGTATDLRLATPADHDAVRRFFHELSAESRRRRFFSTAEPPDTLIARLVDDSNPSAVVTLLATRAVEGELRPIAIGSYVATGPTIAEVAFAVDDHFQGKGLGTILLERLAAIAVTRGFERFEATTLPENAAMIEVFVESGFEVRSRSESGAVSVQLSIRPTEETVALAERRIAAATALSLRPLLEPHAVAVVGASRDPDSLGHRILEAIIDNGFRGAIYPINPAAETVAGLRCYPSLLEARRDIDLAIVAVPRDLVFAVVDQCAAAGVRSLVVITAGFADAGAEGEALQQQLVDRVRGYGMRMVGPNCMGIVNASEPVRLNGSFAPVMPPPGRVALSSQSGALGMAILELAADRGIGLSTYVSAGNKADVSGNDLLQYWELDAATSVILLYLESFGNPRRFARLARRIGRSKPIVCVKSGRGRADAIAGGGHAAALAATDTAVDALFRQSGVLRADTIDDLFDIAACLDTQPLPKGRRVVVITNAGGPGLLAVDACAAAGLTVVDTIVATGAEHYRQSIETALANDAADAVIVIYTPVDRSQMAEIVAGIRSGVVAGRSGPAEKPLLACVLADHGRPKPIVVGGERVPTYAFPENAVRALAKAAAYAEWRAQPQGLIWAFDDIRADRARDICRDALADRGSGWLTTIEAGEVLGAFGVPLSADAAPGDGVEVFVGISEDPTFGPLVAFGLGGIHVEILHDVQFRIAPLTGRDADEMIHGIRGLPLLQGYGGNQPADLDALRELLLRVSRLGSEIAEIVELDLNPVMARVAGRGYAVANARIRVRPVPE